MRLKEIAGDVICVILVVVATGMAAFGVVSWWIALLLILMWELRGNG